MRGTPTHALDQGGVAGGAGEERVAMRNGNDDPAAKAITELGEQLGQEHARGIAPIARARYQHDALLELVAHDARTLGTLAKILERQVPRILSLEPPGAELLAAHVARAPFVL
jgi:hypothetical protein